MRSLAATLLRHTRAPWIVGITFLAQVQALCDSPGSLAELLDLRSVSRLKPWTTLQASGYDRGGGYYDSGNVLRLEPGRRYVLMEAAGPGVVDRMWFTYKSELGKEPYDLLIYLDNPAKPAIQMNLDEFFAGTRPPFVPPLVGLCGHPKHPGRYSYYPIGFATWAKVVLQPTAPPEQYQYRQNSAGDTIPHIYYQITYRRLTKGAAVRPFSWSPDAEEQAALPRLQNIWNRAGLSPWKNGGQDKPHPVEVQVRPGQPALLAEFPQPGTIVGLRLRTDHPELLKLMFYWDHDTDPAVSVPFGPFFACAESAALKTEVRGLWLGHKDGIFYNYLPMPFHGAARLLVASAAEQEVRLTGELDYLQEAPDPDQGQLHVHRYDYAAPPSGEDYSVLTARGRGFFAGIVMDRPGNMEGDDRFFVDHEEAPSLHGTGTEDYFNFAWGLSHTASLPLHGITGQGGGPVCYRFHLPAGVSFRRSLRVTWEHGHDFRRGPNLDEGRYSGVVFYYLRPQSPRAE